MRRVNLILMSVFTAILCGSMAGGQVFAQSRSVGKSSKVKKESAKKSGGKEKKAGYDPVKNLKAQKGETVVRPMEFHGVSESLTELAEKQTPLAKENGKLMRSDSEPVREDYTEPLTLDGPDSFVQTETMGPSAATLGTSFEGPGTGLAGFTLTGAPPDTTMAVGLNHIVAWVNSQYAVFNKSGTLVLGPVNGNTLFAGLGNVCATTNRGDPILQYDRLADRWILSQFAFAVTGSAPSAPYLQCIAVSTTNDPTGTYFRYTISFGSTSPEGFNDYGKLGIWNDAYYTSYNIFGGSPAGGNTGVSLCASDRTKMLAGDPTATTLCAPTAFYGGGASFLPADLDGPEIPTDTTRGGVFIRASTTLNLRLLRLKPDFANSTVTLNDGYGGVAGSFINFPIGATTNACNGSGAACISQPETANLLDTLGTRLMYRFAYRNRGGVDSLVVTHSVDPDGAGVRGASLRWYEIRNPLGNPTDPNTGKRPFLYQNGTFDPGATGDRWMGSMAVNKFGDILIGYSIANATAGLKPSIAVTGRSQCDSLNALQAEQISLTGTGSQTGTLARWGDYSTMQVDPADDTTFWYTTQYLSANGTFNWRTRVVSYSFPTTTAIADGDFNIAANWSNGVPGSSVSGTIPAGRTLTVNNPSTVCNLNVESSGNLVMNADLDVTGSLILGEKINTGASTLGLGCNSTVSGASAANYVIGNVRKDFCRTGAFTYPTGTANGYSPADVNVTALAANPSSLKIKATQSNLPHMDPAQSAHRYWELEETGDLTANLTFNYLDADVFGTEANYKLYRFLFSSGMAVTPFTLNSVANTISTNGVSTFSSWTVGNLAPTAAAASVAGRVALTGGRSIPRAVVILTDQQGNIRTATANNLGNFIFRNVPVGQTYTITANARGYRFAPHVLSVGEDIDSLEITPLN
jgi:hypothetical protein